MHTFGDLGVSKNNSKTLDDYCYRYAHEFALESSIIPPTDVENILMVELCCASCQSNQNDIILSS